MHMTSPAAALRDLPAQVLEAAFYDWHNAHRLRRQRQDVAFWIAMTRISSRIVETPRYADNGRLQGAYGPRLRHWRGRIDQLDYVRRLLQRDPDSRQAVIQLYDAERDTLGYKDVPCTLGYRFFLRDGSLHMHTTMRSQDLWLGFPYDLFTNTLIQELMAGWLDAAVGEYHHHVDSLHLYEQDLEAAENVSSLVAASPPMPTMSLSWESLADVISGVLSGSPPDGRGPGWHSFAQILASYRHWRDGSADAAGTPIAEESDHLSRALERWYQHLITVRDARLEMTA